MIFTYGKTFFTGDCSNKTREILCSEGDERPAQAVQRSCECLNPKHMEVFKARLNGGTGQSDLVAGKPASCN